MTLPTQKDMAEKALVLKQQGKGAPAYLERQTRTPGQGPVDTRPHDKPVSGAIEAEGHRPVLERSRKVR